MGHKITSYLLLFSIIAAVLGDLPSCSRAKCSHCETDLISKLCPSTCSNCNLTPKAKVVAYGQPSVAGAQTELKALPQPPVSAQPLPPAPTPTQQQPQPQLPQQPQYPNQPNPYYPQYQFNGFQQSQQQNLLQPQQPFQFAQYGQQQTPFFNPFQPFLQQSYQAQNPFNPFGFPTFAPVTFAPVTPAPLPTQPTPQIVYPQPQQPQVQFPHAPTYPKVDGGSNQQQGPYQPQTVHVQTPQGPQTQPQIQEKPKQIYNNQQPTRVQPQQTQTPYYQQGPQPQPQQPQQQVAPATNPPIQPPVYPAPPSPTAAPQQPLPIAPAPLPAAPAPPPPQAQTCPRPGWEPCVSKELANERFRNCCTRLGEGCASICSYDQSLATVQVAVLTGRCPIAKVAEMMICASGYEDATPCCEAYGVFEPGFEHCRPYCNPSAGLPNDGMLAEKFRCLGKMSQIQRCFYVTQRP